MKTTQKSAFSLIEMLVVIGIISILMGVIISQFGGATESAKAAKCETNMKNLVTAIHSCALANDDGHFPPAGSFIYKRMEDYKMVDRKRVGWIADSATGPRMNRDNRGSDISFSGDEKMVFHALTNGSAGAMWKAMNRNRSAYQCPVHAEAVRKATKRLPGWSYVMNREFGYEIKNYNEWWGQSKDSISTPRKGDKTRDKGPSMVSRNAAKVLMFAELQGIDITEHGYEPIKAKSYLTASAPLGDAVLDWEKEFIGFNHKTSKRLISGHVAFADGHVERLAYPKSGGGLSLQGLTKALCLGHEISFNGKGYTDLQSNE